MIYLAHPFKLPHKPMNPFVSLPFYPLTLLLLLSPPFQPTSIPTSTQQIITVQATDNHCAATIQRFELKETAWIAVGTPLTGVVGRNSIARKETKREGDGKTPSGLFPIRRAFGYPPIASTKLDYRQVSPTDLWIDDPLSPDYNRWVQAPTTANSFERLRRDDALYRLAAVIEYNTNPIIKGHGSAIFLHIWSGPNQPTSGCVALAEHDLQSLLEWCDPQRNPMILILEPTKP